MSPKLKPHTSASPPAKSRRQAVLIALGSIVLITLLAALLFRGYRCHWETSKTLVWAEHFTASADTLNLIGAIGDAIYADFNRYGEPADSANLLLAMQRHADATTPLLALAATPCFNADARQFRLLNSYGITQAELEEYETYYRSMPADLNDIIMEIRLAVPQGASSEQRAIAGLHLQNVRASLNMLYYYYLSLLSRLPQECRRAHESKVTGWKHLPTDVPADQLPEVYAQLQDDELTHIEMITDSLRKQLENHR